MEKQITVKNLTYRYEDATKPAIQDLSLTVYKGEWLSILGANGSGKSTLAKLLNGLFLPSEGEVIVNGLLTNNNDDLYRIRQQVGIVFQNPDNQIVATTVKEDIAFGLENLGISSSIMEERIIETAEKVGLRAFLDYEPHRLSGGQKQRLAIAGILAMKPAVIILDEATSMLDPEGKKEVLETVRVLNREEEMTVISITHDIEEAAQADRIIVLDGGRIALEGSPRTVFSHEEQIEALGLELPFIVLLRNSLMNKSLPIKRDVFTEEELVDELWKLKLKD
ncbi:MAG TPA: energy-coupling factor transporter ATPase [Bacilli bacterium]|nr:energy-coupling factor transporter ATPase [Bacilli bacterium]